MDKTEFESKTSNFLEVYKPLNFSKLNWHLLYDSEHSRILAIAKSLPAINLLAENTFGCEPWYFVNKKSNRFNESFFGPTWRFEKPWEWKLDKASTTFEYLPFNLGYDELLRFIVVSTKAYVLDKIHTEINILRRPYLNDYLHGQQLIYSEKHKEAIDILSKETIVLDDYPLLKDYSMLVGVDIRIVAEEVVQQYKFQMANLARTEFIRAKYSRAVVNCTELPELKALLVNFNQETNRSAKR